MHLFLKPDDIYLALVMLILASQGIMMVRNLLGSQLLKAVNIPTSAGSYGSTICTNYCVGAIVLVKKGLLLFPDRVLGVVPNTNLSTYISQIHNTGSYSWYKDFSDTSLYNAIYDRIDKHIGYTKMQFSPLNTYGDSYPGDTSIIDKTGGGLIIGRSQLLLQLGAMALIRLTGVNNKVSTTAHLILLVTLTTHSNTSANCVKSLVSANINLSLGYSAVLSAIDSNMNNVTSVLLDKTVLPVFRLQLIAGTAVNGYLQLVVIPDPSKDSIHKSSTLLFPVYKKYLAYDGSSTVQSAKNIRSIKTPLIVCLMSGKTSLLTLYKDPIILTVGVNRALYLNKYYSDKNNIKATEYPKLLLDVACLLLLCLNLSTIFSDHDKETDLFNLTSQQLPDPQPTIITDKHNDTAATYNNAISFINQLLDGSIIIKDGWGSLIRMHGGNIYISSALDTFIRPGRDLIHMVPRITLIQSNGSMTLVSKDNIRIGALHNTCVASGISGDLGVTTILNRSTKLHITKSGVVIRSNGNTTMTASNDMYIGLNDKTLYNRQSDIVRNTTGVLKIDGGSCVELLALKVAIKAQRLVDIYTDDSRLSLQQALAIITRKIVCDSDLVFSSISLDEGHSAGKSHNIITDGLLYNRGVLTLGSVFASQQIVGSTYATIAVPQPDIPSINSTSRKAYYRNFKPIIQNKSYQLTRSLDVVPVCYNDAFICANLFSFPDYTAFIQSDYVIPGMCWQLSSAVSEGYFLPVVVTKTGDKLLLYSYPGKLAKMSGYSLLNLIWVSLFENSYKVNRTNFKEK